MMTNMQLHILQDVDDEPETRDEVLALARVLIRKGASALLPRRITTMWFSDVQLTR